MPPFLSTSHCEFNGARSCAHVRKTIPIPLVLKFNTFIVPSINIESISPTMKRCRLSLFSSYLSCSHLPGHLVWSARRFFYLSFFLLIFIAHFFHEHKSLREPPGYKFYVRFTWNLNTLFKHTFVCLITHSFASVRISFKFGSMIFLCILYIRITTFSLFKCIWELLLHFRLIFFIIWTPFKSFPSDLRWKYYITV